MTLNQYALLGFTVRRRMARKVTFETTLSQLQSAMAAVNTTLKSNNTSSTTPREAVQSRTDIQAANTRLHDCNFCLDGNLNAFFLKGTLCALCYASIRCLQPTATPTSRRDAQCAEREKNLENPFRMSPRRNWACEEYIGWEVIAIVGSCLLYGPNEGVADVRRWPIAGGRHVVDTRKNLQLVVSGIERKEFLVEFGLV